MVGSETGAALVDDGGEGVTELVLKWLVLLLAAVEAAPSEEEGAEVAAELTLSEVVGGMLEAEVGIDAEEPAEEGKEDTDGDDIGISDALVADEADGDEGADAGVVVVSDALASLVTEAVVSELALDSMNETLGDAETGPEDGEPESVGDGIDDGDCTILEDGALGVMEALPGVVAAAEVPG